MSKETIQKEFTDIITKHNNLVNNLDFFIIKSSFATVVVAGISMISSIVYLEPLIGSLLALAIATLPAVGCFIYSLDFITEYKEKISELEDLMIIKNEELKLIKDSELIKTDKIASEYTNQHTDNNLLLQNQENDNLIKDQSNPADSDFIQ